jgi:hypothetical protein
MTAVATTCFKVLVMVQVEVEVVVVVGSARTAAKGERSRRNAVRMLMRSILCDGVCENGLLSVARKSEVVAV